MSWVIAAPEYVAQAAADLAGIATSLGAANSAAAFPTSGVIAAGADEVSIALSALFNSHAEAYQAMSQQAAFFHQQFVNLMSGGGEQYALAEAANANPMGDAAQALGVAATPAAAAVSESVLGTGGGTSFGGGAVGPAAAQSDSHNGWLYSNGAAATPATNAAAPAGLLNKGGAGGVAAASGHTASGGSGGAGGGGWLAALGVAGVADVGDAGAVLAGPTVLPGDAVSSAVGNGLLLAPTGIGLGAANGAAPSGAANGNQSGHADSLSGYGGHSGWLYGDGGALGPYNPDVSPADAPVVHTSAPEQTSVAATPVDNLYSNAAAGGLRVDSPAVSGSLYAGSGGFADASGASTHALSQHAAAASA